MRRFFFAETAGHTARPWRCRYSHSVTARELADQSPTSDCPVDPFGQTVAAVEGFANGATGV
jgi:hypothetical protein